MNSIAVTPARPWFVSLPIRLLFQRERTPEIGVRDPRVRGLDWKQERDCMVQTCVCGVDRLLWVSLPGASMNG